MTSERNRTDLPLLSVAREKGVFVRSLTGDDDNHNVIPEDLSNYKVARAGDLVINKMKAWQGSMGIAPCDGIVSPAYFVFKFRVSNSRFGQALLRSRPYVSHFGEASDGVRVGQWDLSITGMRQIPILIPPAAEQAAIVKFIDWANGRIGRAIHAKRKVIALLNEQKQAIIHRAITRGIDTKPAFKKSGIPWISELPSSWQALPLKRLISYGPKNGISPPPAADEGILSFSISAVKDGIVRIEGNEKLVSIAKEKAENFYLADQDILFVRGNGNLNLVGRCGLVECPPMQCTFPDILIKIRANDFVIPQYLVLASNSAYVRDQVVTAAKTANGAHKISGGTISSLWILVPPKPVQLEILEYVARAVGPISEGIKAIESEISLLIELRTKLVADIVTGKFDVTAATSTFAAVGEAAVDITDDMGTGEIEEDEESIEEHL
jgi:type I restriction enzyme, S subunit